MDIVWILCFILTVIQTVYCSFCPLVNDVVNITRTIDPSKTFIIWNKNGNPVAIAEYNSSSGQCKGPSTAPNYTKHCASGGVYTLEIHNPVNGDLYETDPTTQNQTIFVQDPVKVDVTVTHPPGNTILLQSKSEILPISCTVGCTTPKPYIQWMYQKEDGTPKMFMSNITSPTSTSCSSGKWSINHNLTLSDIVNIKDVSIKVFCQVQYSDCDINDINGTSSASTADFITFTDITSSSLITPTSPTAITSQTSLSSQSPITSQTSLSSQIPITSQSPITSQTPLTSLTLVTLQSPKTSKAPVTSQSPVTSQTSTSDLPTNTGPASNDTLIIIIVFSCIAGIIVIVIVVCCCCFLIRYYRSKKRKEATDNTYDNSSAQFHGRIQPPFKTTDSVRVQTSSKPESHRHISSKQQISTHHPRGQVSSKDDSRKDAHHKRSKLYPELSSHAPYSPYYSQAPVTGYFRHAPSSGYNRQAPSSGYYRQAPSSGYYSQAPSSGYYKTAPSPVYYSQPRSSASNPRHQSGGYRGDQPRNQQFMFY